MTIQSTDEGNDEASQNTVVVRSHVISLIFPMFLSSINLSSLGIIFVVKKVRCVSVGS